MSLRTTGTNSLSLVSTESMAPISRWRRILRVCAVSALILIAGMAACVNVQQHILRWRAERLLSDVRELQLGKSTWIDAKRIMVRWGAWGWYEGSCTSERCTYQIALQDTSRAFSVPSQNSGKRHLESRSCCVWLLWPYRILGGQPALVAATLEVIHGAIWGKGFEFYVIPAVFRGNEGEYVLAAYAVSKWRLKDLGEYPEPTLRDYMVERVPICSGCEAIEARFTPFADPQVIHDLMNFDLACLTRLIPCRHSSDISPSLWQMSSPNNGSTKPAATSPAGTECAISPEIFGRESVNLVIADIVSVKPELKREQRVTVAHLRLLQRLKRAGFWDFSQEYTASLANLLTDAEELPADSIIKEGSKIILAIDTPRRVSSTPFVLFDQCNPLPLTDENLRAVRRGISQDIFPRDGNIWP